MRKLNTIFLILISLLFIGCKSGGAIQDLIDEEETEIPSTNAYANEDMIEAYFDFIDEAIANLSDLHWSGADPGLAQMGNSYLHCLTDPTNTSATEGGCAGGWVKMEFDAFPGFDTPALTTTTYDNYELTLGDGTNITISGVNVASVSVASGTFAISGSNATESGDGVTMSITGDFTGTIKVYTTISTVDGEAAVSGGYFLADCSDDDCADSEQRYDVTPGPTLTLQE